MLWKVALVVALLAPGLVWSRRCDKSAGGRLQNLWGDALDSPDCDSPRATPYPNDLINQMLKKSSGSSERTARQVRQVRQVRARLLDAWSDANSYSSILNATATTNTTCPGIPDRLCKTSLNTTLPLYGVSVTSGEPVTIVQKFPDFLQQVVYELCESSECGVLRGRCQQTYLPYLFLVLPLGPVTLTGQDYVMVESGCHCVPDFT